VNDRTKAFIAVVVAVVAVVAALAYVVLRPAPTGSTPGSRGPATDCGTSPPTSTAGNWTTYHQNNLRTGAESMGPVSGIQALWGGPTELDGQVYAEPLACGNSIFVATENDTVYEVNASDGGVLWHTHLGPPMPGSALPCGDIDPSGITGTPVIDPATGTLYAVAFLSPGRHVLFGLDIANGSILSQATVDPSGSNPLTQQQRGALTLANGYVYVVFGGLDGDCGAYHGWVVGAPTSGSGALVAYQVPTQREGAIWGTAGTSVGANGDLYVATGNGASSTTFDHGDSVIELSPTLSEVGYFAPTNWAQLNADDTDLGSVAPTVLPNGELFEIGKEGVGYLLNGSALGGIGGQIASASVCGGGAYGATAHVGFSIFVPCTDGLFDVTVGTSSLSVAWKTSSFFSGSPIVTGDVVWAVNISTAVLLGFNVSTGQMLFSVPIGGADHFISPTATPGRLFVGAGSQLDGFSLS
jgi:hypothetical protein